MVYASELCRLHLTSGHSLITPNFGDYRRVQTHTKTLLLIALSTCLSTLLVTDGLKHIFKCRTELDLGLDCLHLLGFWGS